MSQKI